MVGDWAEDAVQDGYLNAIQYWYTYDEGMEFNNWIGRIIHNATRKTAGWIKGNGDSSSDEEKQAEPVIVNQFFTYGSDIKLAQAREAYLRIQKVEHEPTRHCLQYALIDECTSDEVALLTGIKANTVRQIVKRWRDQNRDVVR